MAMNRETKRMLQRQGQMTEDGAPTRERRRPPAAPRPEAREKRTGPREFVKEVRAELRKVAWPTKSETINYSIIVLVAVVVLTAFVGGLDYLFGQFVLHIYNSG
jgi:preprotein translocase subunit SecE